VSELPVEIVLDISRLLSRVAYAAPTGVDRVEMAYAQGLLQRVPERLVFAAVHPYGMSGRLSRSAAERFVTDTSAAWAEGIDLGAGGARLAGRAKTLAALLPRAVPSARAAARPRVYLQVSPHHLDQTSRMRRILQREQARFVCLVHDLIPIEFPEYATLSSPPKHLRRMHTVAVLADGVIANSKTTLRSLQAHLGDQGRELPMTVAPLGADAYSLAGAPMPELSEPYFLVIGTIEPRKNHLLLLNVWRRLVETMGRSGVPKLFVVGRRGWENENVVDMLERSPALQGVVEEMGNVSDLRLRHLTRGARAVLMPSFVEGFGLPVVEALQAGAPVICSDIDAHREIAGSVADFIDPLDGIGWLKAVLDYTEPHSVRRGAQIERLSRWTAPEWNEHFKVALAFIDSVGG
jgi:glycosyltransferase involved in cell wall biosynthesis